VVITRSRNKKEANVMMMIRSRNKKEANAIDQGVVSVNEEEGRMVDVNRLKGTVVKMKEL